MSSKMDALLPALFLYLLYAELATGQSFSCSSDDHLRIRLNQAGYFTDSRSGRVEICECRTALDCEWATITVPSSSISWGWKNAQVACRERFPQDYGVMNPILQDTLPSIVQASGQQPVFSSMIFCDGTEARIAQCSMTSSSVASHARDAHIKCRSSMPDLGDVRLTGSASTDSFGVVEIYRGSTIGWVTVCSDAFDSVDSSVICFQLGYEPELGGETSIVISSIPGLANNTVGLCDVSCTGSESHLSSCSFTTCNSCLQPNARAGVSCTPTESPEGSIRLYPSTAPESSFDQRVEVLYNGRWGTVCNIDWDTNDGEVACRALGGGSATIDTAPLFSSVSSNRPIWLTQLACEGSESSFNSCEKTLPVGYVPSCAHTEDAALACVGGGGLSFAGTLGVIFGVIFVFVFVVPFTYSRSRKWVHDHDPCGRVNRFFAGICTCCTLPTLRHRRPANTQRQAGRVTATRGSRTRERSHSTSTTSSSSGNSDGVAVRRQSPPRSPSPDTTLRKGAPPSYSEAVHFIAAAPKTSSDPPQYTASEQPGEPETSLPSYPISGARLPYPSTTGAELPYPQTTNAEVPYPPSRDAEVPHPPGSVSEVPYPQIGLAVLEPSDVQGYPPPTHPGYPLQPITDIAFPPADPLGDVGIPLPPLPQPIRDENISPPPSDLPYLD